ncbi:MAG TPA: glycosyltransferase, partial [Anaerolineae bacterium]
MRIALNAWFHEQPDTGSGQYTRNLISALKEISPQLDIQLVTPNRRSNLSKVFFEQIEFPRAAEKMQAHIAFVPYWAAPMQCQVPLVVTVHDVIPLALPQYRGGPLQRLYTSLVRTTSAKASAIITDSDNSKADIIRLLPVEHSDISAIPLAADCRYTSVVSDEDIERINARYHLPTGYVLYLGGYDWRKNIETLLRTYRWCVDTIGDEFPLVINGARETRVQMLSGSGMTLGAMLDEFKFDEGRVRLIGRIAEEDKPAL